MKRVLVVSDSHGYAEGIKRIAEQVWQDHGPVDVYLHCGDGGLDLKRVEAFLRKHDPACTMAMVRGNCDGYGYAEVPEDRVVTVGETHLYMAHGHYLDVKHGRWALASEARLHGCSIALYGHTHEPLMENLSVLVLNPGCAHMGQYLVLELENGQPGIHLEHLGMH